MEVVGVETEDQGSRCTRDQLFCQQHGQWPHNPAVRGLLCSMGLGSSEMALWPPSDF